MRPGRLSLHTKGLFRGVVAALLLSACTTAAPAPSVGPAAGSAGPAASVITTALPAAPAGWQSYTEASLGYSLSFPQDVEFTSGTSKAGIYTARLQFSLPDVEGYQGMVVRAEPNPNRVGVEQVVEALYRRTRPGEPAGGWAQETMSATVAGLSGVQLGRGADFSLIVPYGDKVYIVAPVHDTATVALDPQALALFYQILATLKVAP